MNFRITSYLFIFLISLASCKTDKKENEISLENKISITEKIANAHGFENWNKVNSIQFTFNVKRDTSLFKRTWIWKPKTNEITKISKTDSIVYNRTTMDSITHKINSGFINDRYWLLAPFNLVWDASNFKYNLTENAIAPLSQKSMQKLTIIYNNEGGYTPGDAYDFYFNDDYLIKEWVFRKANQKEPSMTTTWENYVNHNGFMFAMEHKKTGENFNLFFDGIQTNM